MFIPISAVVFITISSAWKLKFFGGYCFELCTCARFFETVFGGLGLGLETLVLTTRLALTHGYVQSSHFSKELLLQGSCSACSFDSWIVNNCFCTTFTQWSL